MRYIMTKNSLTQIYLKYKFIVQAVNIQNQ